MSSMKREWISNAPIEVLQKILNVYPNQHEKPSKEVPLGGKVYVTGVGYLKVADLRAEIERRTEVA